MAIRKLVRDKIPQILRKSGIRGGTFRRARRNAIPTLLLEKLDEEVCELRENVCLEELADVAEVLREISIVNGFKWLSVERERTKKRRQKGGFARKILMTSR
jgi:predicted house-cleaning noncanonical NTP pyrophosphatase (MazG superfamily)